MTAVTARAAKHAAPAGMHPSGRKAPQGGGRHDARHVPAAPAPRHTANGSTAGAATATLLTASASALCGVLLLSSPAPPSLLGRGGDGQGSGGLLTGPAAPSFVEPTRDARQPITLSGAVLQSSGRTSTSTRSAVPTYSSSPRRTTREAMTSAGSGLGTAAGRDGTRTLTRPRRHGHPTRAPQPAVTVSAAPSIPPVPVPVPVPTVPHPLEGDSGDTPRPPTHPPTLPVVPPTPPMTITPPAISRATPAPPAIAAKTAIAAMGRTPPPVPRIVSGAVTAATGGRALPAPETVTRPSAGRSEEPPAPVIRAMPTAAAPRPWPLKTVGR